jgi:hypothetical protein
MSMKKNVKFLIRFEYILFKILKLSDFRLFEKKGIK